MWRVKSNSARGHSADQAKGTDVDTGDGEGDRDTAVREHRGKDAGVESDGSRARLHENQDWLRLNGQPAVRHRSGDVDP